MGSVIDVPFDSRVIDVPFGPPVPEIELPLAPLVLAVAQVRFERLASISSEGFIGGFQEAIRQAYPVMLRQQHAGVLIGPDGRVVPGETSTAWRFDERPEQWQVTLAPDFVSLSTTRYTRRQDFMDRLRNVLAAAQEHLGVRFSDRAGVRYIDRVTDPELLARLRDLVRPEVLGTAGVHVGEAVQQVHTFSDTTYQLPDGVEFHARWGLLPPLVTFDPAIEPGDVRSWVLDLDAYTTGQEPFDPAALTARAEALSERVYRFFRWAVTDDFLVAHGGQL
jgi:uncharacterized protein (TIGR04255 family)